MPSRLIFEHTSCPHVAIRSLVGGYQCVRQVQLARMLHDREEVTDYRTYASCSLERLLANTFHRGLRCIRMCIAYLALCIRARG